MKHSFRALLALIITALFGSLLTAVTAAPAQAASSGVTVVTANLGSGTVVGEPWGGTAATANSNSILGRAYGQGADVIAMQELCRSQYDWTVANSVYKYGAFEEMTDGDETPDKGYCAPGEGKGTAILSKWPLWGTPEVVNLNGPITVANGKEFRLICIVPKKPGFRTDSSPTNQDYLTTCTTHLWSAGPSGTDNDAIRDAQAQIIKSTLNIRAGASSNHKVVLTGDFNSVPKTAAIDKIHRVGFGGGYNTTAKFWEGDQSRLDSSYGCTGGATTLCRAGRATTVTSGGADDRKLDYIFGSFEGLNEHTGIDMTRIVQVAGPGVYGAPDPHRYLLDARLTWTDLPN